MSHSVMYDFTPRFADHCGHGDENYLFTMTYPISADLYRGDRTVDVYRNHSAFAGEDGVCIRHGNVDEEYGSVSYKAIKYFAMGGNDGIERPLYTHLYYKLRMMRLMSEKDEGVTQ